MIAVPTTATTINEVGESINHAVTSALTTSNHTSAARSARRRTAAA
jgi:hypothetical protein